MKKKFINEKYNYFDKNKLKELNVSAKPDKNIEIFKFNFQNKLKSKKL